MTNNNFILTTSGFLLPSNSYFVPFKSEDSFIDKIFDRFLVVSTSSALIEYFKANNVYMSYIVNNKIDAYIKTKDFKDYISLLDIIIDIVKNIQFDIFFKIQASNKNLSPIGFKFCLDVTSGEYFNNYNEYNIVPFNIRFSINNNLTTEDSIRNIKQIEKNINCQRFANWEYFLSNLANNKNAFLTFCKFVLADYY